MIFLIKKRIKTSKTLLQELMFNRYTFDMDTRLNKPQIKTLFKALYKVPVGKVRTHRRPLQVKSKLRKPRYSHGYKRVIVQLPLAIRLP